MTQLELEEDDDSGDERPLYIKEEDDEEVIKEEASMDSTDGNDTRLSDLHNTTLKTEEDSEEDKPLVNFVSIISIECRKKEDRYLEIIAYLLAIFRLCQSINILLSLMSSF